MNKLEESIAREVRHKEIDKAEAIRRKKPYWQIMAEEGDYMFDGSDSGINNGDRDE